MNPVYVSIIASIVVQALIAVYVYGRLTEKTANNSDDIRDLKKSDAHQWEAIGDVQQDVARIQGTLGKVNGAAR